MFHWDFLLNAESFLSWLLAEHKSAVYLALFLTLFLESGAFFMPFLPGDSLLLLSGATLSKGSLDMGCLLAVVIMGSLLGNIFGYGVGFISKEWLGFERALGFFNDEWLILIKNFFVRYGGMSVVFVRFMPLFRTFFPFLAGVFRTSLCSFSIFSLLGSVIWGGFFVLVGKFLGEWLFVQQFLGRLTIAVVCLTFVSLFMWMYKRRATCNRK